MTCLSLQGSSFELEMYTVTQLARHCGLSRATLLYYESIGLFRPAARTAANYRRYGDKELRRLRQIRIYRDAGVGIEDIRALLDRPADDASAILERRLAEIEAEIGKLRGHQRAILALLRDQSTTGRSEIMTKDKWVSIMRASGFSEADMHRWHFEFERNAPDDHQQFLEYLHIAPEEIRSIRDRCAKAQA